MRIAIIGGTFNPIHYGHLRVAEEVREALDLTRVLFIPVCLPPHKGNEDVTDARLRLEMVRLAIMDNTHFEVSDMEIKRGGRSYTIDTLRELKKGSHEELETTVIVGTDSFNEITTWHHYDQLFTLTDFAVVPRPGYPGKKIEEVLPVELASKFWYDEERKAYTNSYGHRVTWMDTTLVDISSSEIRRRVRAGMSIMYLMPPVVEEYIIKKGIYK
jgi:nicotinate-nucleotide adenylyltransferase